MAVSEWDTVTPAKAGVHATRQRGAGGMDARFPGHDDGGPTRMFPIGKFSDGH
jgi:hypothetical protein